MNIDRIIGIVRKLNEEMMVTGSSSTGAGFGGSAQGYDPGPTAGYDKPLNLDGRSRMMRRLPPEYRKSLQKTKKKKR